MGIQERDLYCKLNNFFKINPINFHNLLLIVFCKNKEEEQSEFDVNNIFNNVYKGLKLTDILCSLGKYFFGSKTTFFWPVKKIKIVSLTDILKKPGNTK